MLFFNKWFLRLIKVSNRFIFIAAALLILLSSLIMYLLEPDTFENPFNSFWWVMTTVTTVGYGDFYPRTVLGKCFGIFLFVIGIGLISVVISKVVDTIWIYNRKKEEGKLRYLGEQHFVIIDWSKHAGLAIEEILSTDTSVEIVLIDQLEKTPIHHERVHYIQGNPIHKKTLEQANINRAKAVFIFANEETSYQSFIRDSSFVDGKTLLIATSIERNYPSTYTIVEIKDKENIHNFVHVKVDEFILGSEMVSRLAVRSAFHPGASKLMTQLVTWDHGEDLFQIPRRAHWRTYRDAFEELLQEGATLLSDGEKMNINRRLDEPIGSEARLFVICDKEVYKKLVSI